jgi:hypothetical protein
MVLTGPGGDSCGTSKQGPQTHITNSCRDVSDGSSRSVSISLRYFGQQKHIVVPVSGTPRFPPTATCDQPSVEARWVSDSDPDHPKVTVDISGNMDGCTGLSISVYSTDSDDGTGCGHATSPGTIDVSDCSPVTDPDAWRVFVGYSDATHAHGGDHTIEAIIGGDPPLPDDEPSDGPGSSSGSSSDGQSGPSALPTRSGER